MKFQSHIRIGLATLLVTTISQTLLAQSKLPSERVKSSQQPLAMDGDHSEAPQRGPHGGRLRQLGEIQVECWLTHGGVQLAAFDRRGQRLPVDAARGVVTVSFNDSPKRYRYDLIPDGDQRLVASVDLSKLAGQQIEINLQLVGLPETDQRLVRLRDVATVPLDPASLAAAAIARQHICPVSHKQLGSMGEPIATRVDGQTIYACCAACLGALHANPQEFESGRPAVRLVNTTSADRELIETQGSCPVMDEPLGSMGGPVKLLVGERPVFLCCRGCIKRVEADPLKYMPERSDAQELPPTLEPTGEAIRPGVFATTAADAGYLAKQRLCPVMDEPLEAMGGPFRVSANGKAVYICCPGCAKKIEADPAKYLELLGDRGVQAPTISR